MQDAPRRVATRTRLAAAVVILDRLLHDLKQPLNLVRMVAQDVTLDARKNRLDPASIPDSMEEIIEAVDQLTGSINQLRAFARPGGEGAEFEPLQVEEACRAAAARMRQDLPEAEIEEQFAPELPAVRGDPLSLEQAVWELLDNALRAAGQVAEDAPRARVVVRAVDQSVVVTVSDRGGGVSEEIRPRMFDPFTTSQADAGGLGLALARALVRDLGGQLRLAQNGDPETMLEILLPAES